MKCVIASYTTNVRLKYCSYVFHMREFLSVCPLGFYLDRSGRQCDLHLAEGECRGLREKDGKEEVGSDHGHNCVSTYARIAITIVYPEEEW